MARTTDPDVQLLAALGDPTRMEIMRELAGKPSVGTLALNAYQKGNHVVLEVEDDGAGMSPDKLFETAARRGLSATPAHCCSPSRSSR